MAAHRAKPLEINYISMVEKNLTRLEAHPLVTQIAQANFSSWLANRKRDNAIMEWVLNRICPNLVSISGMRSMRVLSSWAWYKTTVVWCEYTVVKSRN